jgi:hypothetical protein
MFKKIKISELPKRTRKARSRFELTPEWRQLKKVLDAGLKKDEACSVGFTDAEMAEYRIKNWRTISRFIEKYIRNQELPYIVKSQSNGDLHTVLVLGPQSWSLVAKTRHK